MTSVPVVWLTYEPGTLHRGHWDESFITDLFDRHAWRPAGGLTFEHWPIDCPEADWPETSGAVFVFPARHNATHVREVTEALGKYRWAVIVGAGDEEFTFGWAKIRHRHASIWAMGARPGHGSQPVDVPLGSGYSPGFPELLRAGAALVTPGRLDVFFCGQDTHPRRHDAIAAARGAVPDNRRLVVPTSEFLADGTPEKGGMPRCDYAHAMTEAKFVLCPAGPESPDSFRLYEALEAGAIPIADGATQHGPVPGYWQYVFGGAVPFPVVGDWAELPAVLADLSPRWAWHAARCSAWWIDFKRRMAYRMDDDVRSLGSIEPEYATPDEKITVICPTCPIPSHPDTWMIEEVVDSIRAQLPTAEIIIPCDGMRPSMADHQADYDEFLLRLTRLCAHKWSNVVPVILDEWHHQAASTRVALEKVRTPLILFVEHDTPLTGEIDWTGLCALVETGTVNMVRLHHETQIGEPHKHMALDEPEVHLGASDARPEGVPVVRTVQWSQRPHLATTAFYRERVMPMFPATLPSTYIEWVLHGAVTHGVERGLDVTWDKWRVAIYYPPGGNIQRSLHLDGRAGAPTEDSVEAFKKMRGQ